MITIPAMENVSKIIIFHHDDMDGIVGAKIIEGYIKDTMIAPVIKLRSCNYTQEMNKEGIDENTFVIIVDYTPNMNDMLMIIDTVGRQKMLWFDHHITALRKFEKLQVISLIPGIRVSGSLSGSEIAYLYLFKGAIANGGDKLVIDGIEYKFIDNPADLTAIINKEPLALRHLGGWDTWRDVSNGSIFHHGYKSEVPKYNEDSEATNSFFAIFYKPETVNADEIIEKIMSTGRIITRFLTKKYELEVCMGASVSIKLGDNLHYHCISVNTTEHSSLVFDSVRGRYELGIIYHRGKSLWKFSIYRLDENPEKDIDVSVIAQSFGGGGHRKAAGWVTKWGPYFD